MIELRRDVCSDYDSLHHAYHPRSHVHEDVPKNVLVDCTKIKQMVAILLDNAFKNTPPKAHSS